MMALGLALAVSNGGLAFSSSDYRYEMVAFRSHANVFVHDRETGTTEQVSIHSNGDAANGFSYELKISADGRYVAFHSEATTLVDSYTNSQRNVFVHDRETNTTTRVSVDVSQSSRWIGSNPIISEDGRSILFESDKDLVGGNSNGQRDIYVVNNPLYDATRADGTAENRETWGGSGRRYIHYVG